MPTRNMILSPTSTSYLRTKVSLPSSPNAEYRHRRHRAYLVAVVHIHRQIVLRDQHASAGIDVKTLIVKLYLSRLALQTLALSDP
jgi:hypothetical protein